MGVFNPADNFLSDLQACVSGDSNPLATGIGATTPWLYAQVKARVQFLQALHRLVPRATTDLLTDGAFELMRQRAMAQPQVAAEWEALFQAVEQATNSE